MCGDPETVWYPQRTVCYADMATAAVRWQYDQIHGPDSHVQFHDGSFKVWAAKRSNGFPYSAEDGVSLWVASEDLTPDDHFLGEPETNDDEAVT